jgi:hypothetical protein
VKFMHFLGSFVGAALNQFGRCVCMLHVSTLCSHDGKMVCNTVFRAGWNNCIARKHANVRILNVATSSKVEPVGGKVWLAFYICERPLYCSTSRTKHISYCTY